MMHPYGWMSLLPPVAAIVLAIITRKAVVSLIVGIFVGAMITHGGNPFTAAYDTAEIHLWATFIEPGKLRVFSFTLLMGAMIGVICRNGGMQGFIHLLAPLARTRMGGQLTTWLLGLLIFFDDYANTMLLGGALRPVCDRLRISREKLAYLVDSTAAPVAGLSLLSTWVAVEIDYVKEGLAMLDATGSGGGLKAFDLFIASIPYRFYILLSLVLIPILALTGREFGPMLVAEQRRQREPLSDKLQKAGVEVAEDLPGRWPNAVLPIVATLGVVMWLLFSTGRQKLVDAGVDMQSVSLRDILGEADSSYSLQYGALVGLMLAAGLSWAQRLLNWEQIVVASAAGAKVVLPAIAILLAASALSRMTSNNSVDGKTSIEAGVETYKYQDHRLYTGDYLKELVAPGSMERDGGDSAGGPVANQSNGGVFIKLLPTLVFLLSAVVAFCTGTSFGTMGILMPMVVSLAYTLLTASGAAVTADHPILLASVGGVLAGAVFGDHCSPISDTTILSSQSCSCDHIAHVVTQMPYALTVAVVTVVCGTLPLGWGWSTWTLLPLQCGALVAVVFVFGKRVETDDPGDNQ